MNLFLALVGPDAFRPIAEQAMPDDVVFGFRISLSVRFPTSNSFRVGQSTRVNHGASVGVRRTGYGGLNEPLFSPHLVLPP